MGSIIPVISVLIMLVISQDLARCQTTENTFTTVLTTLKNQLKTSCDTVGIVTQVLVREIEERVKLQANSESRISHLEAEIGNCRKDPVVAFSVRLSAHVRGLTREQKIIFGDAITNLGNAYSPATGEFRCPVTGLYHFGVTILGEQGEIIETELMAAGVSRMKMYSGAVQYFGSGSNSVLLELQEGDIVFVRLHLSTGSKAHAVWSTFSGHLLRQI